MTEIKIERKKQTLLWLLAGFVIAALLINFLIFRDKDNINTAEAVNNEPFETSLAKNIRNATDNSTTAMQHM